MTQDQSRPGFAGSAPRIGLVAARRDATLPLATLLGLQGFELNIDDDVDEARAAATDLTVVYLPTGAAWRPWRTVGVPSAPVLLVCELAEEVDRIVALELGADDVVSTDCSPREIAARIRAILRRRAPGPALTTSSDDRAIDVHGYRLLTHRHELVDSRGERAILSRSDTLLLQALAEAGGEVMSRDELYAATGFTPSAAGARCSLDTNIARLRRKLAALSSGGPVIRTVHGVGYALDPANILHASRPARPQAIAA